MPFRTHRFTTTQELDDFLNGSVIGMRPIDLVRGKVHGLHNLTLIINATTVTFSDAAGAGLTLAAIITAITGAVSGTSVRWRGERTMVIEHATGVTVDKDGTANAIFGFSSAADLVGTVHDAYDGSPPRWLQVDAAPTADAFYVVVETA